ncbi:MAG: hypothetical protein ACRCYU_22675 [Nocardioides sp.]
MTSHDSCGRIATAIGATLVLTGGLLNTAASSQAATTKNYQAIVWPGNTGGLGPGHTNYDTLTQRDSGDNVDWPVTLLFVNNANQGRAKSRIKDWSNHFEFPSPKNFNMLMAKDLSRPRPGALSWDTDGGNKTPLCPAIGFSSPHFRMYAPGTDERMYSPELGYFTVATTHIDYNECPPIGKKHKWPERIEEVMVRDLTGDTAIRNDYWNLHNPEPFRVEGDHTWDNNAFASEITIP